MIKKLTCEPNSENTYTICESQIQLTSSFPNSPQTTQILQHFSQKFGQLIAPIGLTKLLSVISPHVNNYLPNLNILHVAPSRQFKTQTNLEVQKLIPKHTYFNVKDDDTLNAILERVRKGNTANLGTKTLFFNDATTMFASKNRRTKERLVSGLSVLLSDGAWSYGERLHPDLTLKGNLSAIMNMTLQTYKYYEKSLLTSTFVERFLTLFYALPEKEIDDFLEHINEKRAMEWKFKLQWKFKPFQITNLKEYQKLLIDYADRYSTLSLKSKLACYDSILALIKAHLSLNNRTEITKDELTLLKMLEPYLINPISPNKPRIIAYYKEGRSQKDICLLLGMDYDSYKPYVSRVIKEAKQRGVIK